MNCGRSVSILSGFSYIITDAILEQLINPRRTLLGDEVSFIRKALHFSLAEIADKIGINKEDLAVGEERCRILSSPYGTKLKELVRVRIVANRMKPQTNPVFGSTTDPPRGCLRGKILLYC